MKNGVNKVTLVGNVGDEPKINHFDNDGLVANFPLATNEIYVDKNGGEVKKPNGTELLSGITEPGWLKIILKKEIRFILKVGFKLPVGKIRMVLNDSLLKLFVITSLCWVVKKIIKW